MVRAMSDWHTGLTERQRKFCEAFAANGGNGTDAARQAGYARPDPEGSRLLGKARIAAALEAMRASHTSAAIMTREERQALWSAIARGEALDGHGEAPKFSERLKASELLGKSQADFIDRVRHEGEDGRPLSIRVELVEPAK